MLSCVLAATLMVYLRCLGNGFVWDDELLILGNQSIGQWSFIWKSFTRHEYWFSAPNRQSQLARYRPLLLTWIALNYHLFGLKAAWWHAAEVALHLVGVWLVFKIAMRLTGQSYAALLTALFFGLLPIHAEGVVWSAAAGVPLSGVLSLAAFYVVIRNRALDWLLASILFLGAMLSHECAAAFPGLVGLYALLIEERADGGVADKLRPRLYRAAVRMAPFVAVLLIYFVIRRLALGFALVSPNAHFNAATPAQVLMTIPWVLATYLVAMAVPMTGVVSHRVLFVKSAAAAHFYVPLAALVALAVAFLLAVRNHPRRRLYLFAAGWVIVALAPMMSLFAMPEDGLAVDAYAYLASFGWCLLMGDWLASLAYRRAWLKLISWAAAFALAAACAVALWKTQHLFHDDAVLLSDCLKNFPESRNCHKWSAYKLQEKGDFAGAEREFRTALSLAPTDGLILYDLGVLDGRFGRTREATKEIAAGLKFLGLDAPVSGYLALAEVYDAQGNQSQSEAALTAAEAIPGGAEMAQMTRARLRVKHGDGAGAEAIMRALTRGYPDDQHVWTMLGLLMFDEKRYQEASASFESALKLAPDNIRPHLFQARALHKLARNREALEECRRALAIDPNNAEAQELRKEIAGESARQ